jgi:tetratricopeptide (TPR) repeat protein
MDELLRRSTGTLDVTRSAAILRDRELPGDRFAGNGHRSSLNPLIATHSVIMDLTDDIFWAATPPHQMGRFAAFDINQPEKMLPELAMAGDPMLADGEYKTYLAAKTGLSDGWRALKHSDLAAAIQCAQTAEKDNPGFYQNSWLLAEVLFRQGKYPESAAAARQAMDGKPALGGERRRIEQILTQAEAHK